MPADSDRRRRPVRAFRWAPPQPKGTSLLRPVFAFPSPHPVFRTDHRLRKAVKDLHLYRGTIRNRNSIGMSAAELVARWNAEHPDDPVTDAA